MNKHHLILGGAKSGKTAFAEQLVLSGSDKPLYIATGRAWDDEMRNRIDAHQKIRADKFVTIEEPLALIDALETNANVSQNVLVDCLTLWITNLMMEERSIENEVDKLSQWLSSNTQQRVILVSNEVGQGIVPENKMARSFVDHAGISHQKLAAVCHRVSFITAGLEQRLKG